MNEYIYGAGISQDVKRLINTYQQMNCSFENSRLSEDLWSNDKC